MSEACGSCDGRVLCELRIDQLRNIEERAKKIGALAAEGSITCDKGPRRFIRDGLDVRLCRVDPIMPMVTDVELAEEIANIWPGAPLQPVRE